MRCAEAVSGNICRCTGYEKYIDGILLAAERMYSEEWECSFNDVIGKKVEPG